MPFLGELAAANRADMFWSTRSALFAYPRGGTDRQFGTHGQQPLRGTLACVRTARESMNAELKRMVADTLRPRGFAGSLPHLRRRRDNRIELVSVQFLSAGGSFAVEIAACGIDGHTTSWGKTIAPSKVTARDMNPPNRPRLGAKTFPTGDHWFVFGPRSDEPGADAEQPDDHYARIAGEVARLIEAQAEPWWESYAGSNG